MENAEIYIHDSVTHAPDPGIVRTWITESESMVNVQKAGEVYRCNICGNVVFVKEAGGGELVCHGEPMQLVEKGERKTQ